MLSSVLGLTLGVFLNLLDDFKSIFPAAGADESVMANAEAAMQNEQQTILVEETAVAAAAWFQATTTEVATVGALLFAIAVYFYRSRRKEAPVTLNFRPVQAIAPVRSSISGGFVTKMRLTGRNVAVFYGSQTGTAEDLANRLTKDASRYGMKGAVLDPEECEMEDLIQISEIPNGLAIFCVATYGEGDPTDNAQELHEFLQNGEVDLTGLNYAVFGLGNKTYEHFNSMGKFVDKRLAELGATRVYELGLGDDDGNVEEDFMVWREGFWPAVCEFFHISEIGAEMNTRQYTLTVHEDIDSTKVYNGEMSRLTAFTTQKPPFDTKNPFLAPIVVNRELHAGGERSCRHIEFNITGSRLRYEAGDHAAVYASNDPQLVERFGEILNTDLSTVITLTNVDEDSSKKHPFPCPCSYRTALLHYVDLVSAPRTHVLKELSEYCSNPEEKDFLKSMSSAKDESRKKYLEWIVGDRRTLMDILIDLPSCRPPLDHVLELLPRLQPRYYSISSSPKDNPEIISITAVVVEYQTRIGRTVKGVATNFLATKIPTADLQPKVPIFVRRSQLRLPHQLRTPVIMIGPGTGLAPFRGFIQDRFHHKKKNPAVTDVGSIILYFGCRRKAEDYIYEEELVEWRSNGTLNELHVAFSRDQSEKVYVQNLLTEQKENTWKLLQHGAHIYVCGDARNMAKMVRHVFVEIAIEQGKMTPDEAQNFVKKMENQKRYQADVWS